MVDPTFVEQLVGISRAGTNLIVTGMLLVLLSDHLPNALVHDWRIHTPDGYIPGLVELPTSADQARDDTWLDYSVGMLGAILWFGISYMVLCGLFLIAVFVGSLWFGHPPATYPWLYRIGAVSVIIGLSSLSTDRGIPLAVRGLHQD